MNTEKQPDFREIGTIFFQDGYRLAKKYTGPPASKTGILQLMAEAYESIDGLIESFIKRCSIEGIPVDCHKGCGFCCSQAILASNHEIMVIWQYMSEHLDADTVFKIRSHTLIKHEKTRGMSAMEFLHYIHPCPLLLDGSCTIYPVRPMACRCYLSSNLQSCIEQHDKPEDRTAVAALFDFPLQAGRGMNEGIRSALMESGLIPSEWLLEFFMAALFEDGQKTDLWLSGDRPFNIRSLSPEENRYMREYYLFQDRE